VLGKTGYTVKHPSVSSMKGVAAQGSLLGVGRSVIVEVIEVGAEKGDLVLTVDGQERLRAKAATKESETHEDTFEHQDGTVTCWLTWESNNLNNLPGAQSNDAPTNKKPVIGCKLREASDPAQEFMRIFVERMNSEHLDVIVTMKKRYGTKQNGICGNFDGDSSDDGKDGELEAWKRADGDWPGSPVPTPARRLAVRGLEARRLDDVPEQELQDAWDRCESANVAKGLRAGCAEDIVLVADKTDFPGDAIIEEYQTFSGLWKATR